MSLVAVVLGACGESSLNSAGVSEFNTTVSQWKDGKVAAYLLAFDDNLPSQWQNAIPQLEAHRLAGTFYVVPGSASWNADEQQWVNAATSEYVTLANHTFTHQGVSNVEQLDAELAEANDAIYRIYRDRQPPLLLGWAKPGGVPWLVTEDEQSAALQRHNLVDRPPFKGSPTNYASLQELLTSVDEAIATGGMGHNDMHGIGGDYLATPMEWFVALLDKLEAERDQVWVPDVVSYMQYVTERKSARITMLNTTDQEVRLELTSRADPILYDYPLTLITEVPRTWVTVSVTQGNSRTEVSSRSGFVTYDVTPGAGEVRIARV